MSKLLVEGGHRLNGEIKVQGSKNSVLPILSACILMQEQCVIHNCPDLLDVDAAIAILEHLGCKVSREPGTIVVDPSAIGFFDIPEELMREMRSSIVFLGAIAARMGRARVSMPGGCEIGVRPIDLHLSSLRQLGLSVDESHGHLDCTVDGRMKGARIVLPLPSVGATENIMLAAATARGRTTVLNAAREPEISDLADFLNGCGARIHGAGEGTVVIDGVERLSGTEHTVISDRIAAATFMAAAAVTRGNITLKEIVPAHLGPVLPAFEEAGCDIVLRGQELTVSAPPKLQRIRTVRTSPFPGFPTDAQAPLMALTTLSDGTSMFVENIFESRYKHVGELNRLGAHIKVEGRVAIVEGVPKLSGACVRSTDLRGAAALVIAGLSAEGVTTIEEVSHLYRGYENIEECLTRVGAEIKREDQNENE